MLTVSFGRDVFAPVRRRLLLAVALIACALLFAAAPGGAVAQMTFTEVDSALLPDGTSYGMRVPASWNGAAPAVGIMIDPRTSGSKLR
jgi:hypothetical protein